MAVAWMGRAVVRQITGQCLWANRTMSSKSSVYNQPDHRVREVQRKLAYMRADVPPKGSLSISVRTKSDEDNGVSPKKVQAIHELFLNNDKYQYLKESFNKSPTSYQSKNSTSNFNHSNDSTRSDRENYLSPSSSFHHRDSHTFQSFKTDSHSPQQRAAQQLLSPTAVETTNANSPNFANMKHDMATHPLVQELAERGLTMSCKKRKLQTAVRKEVETKLLLQT